MHTTDRPDPDQIWYYFECGQCHKFVQQDERPEPSNENLVCGSCLGTTTRVIHDYEAVDNLLIYRLCKALDRF